jgi:hypothetical protein
MNNTLDKKGVISPFASRQNIGMIDVRDENHPVKEEVKRLCSNSYTIKVTFEEDRETNKLFAHIPGLITILCKFSLDGQVIAIGRSYSIFSRLNKYITRTVSNTLNGAFLSASNHAVKVLEAYRAGGSEEVDKPVIYEEEDLATDKQKGYLASLIEERIPFKERPKWIQELSNNLLTRIEASEKINNLLNNY